VRDRRAPRTPLVAGDGPLAKVPPIAAFAVVMALFVTGVLVRGVVGAALLGLLALGVAVLLAGTWRVLTPPARAGRLVVLAALSTIAVLVILAK
jgi:hypothetical protein